MSRMFFYIRFKRRSPYGSVIGVGRKTWKKKKNKVCKLKKTFYKLKQSLRTWFGRFTKEMEGMRHIKSQGYYLLFLIHQKMNKVIILILYVDDIVLLGNDLMEMEGLKR